MKNGMTITLLIRIYMAKIVLEVSGKTNLIHREDWYFAAIYLDICLMCYIFMIAMEN